MFIARVYVTLKSTVNDPQGLTVKSGLRTLGFHSVQDVRIGKYMELQVDADSTEDAVSQVDRMCRQLLANTVIEQFRFDVEAMTPSDG